MATRKCRSAGIFHQDAFVDISKEIGCKAKATSLVLSEEETIYRLPLRSLDHFKQIRLFLRVARTKGDFRRKA